MPTLEELKTKVESWSDDQIARYNAKQSTPPVNNQKENPSIPSEDASDVDNTHTDIVALDLQDYNTLRGIMDSLYSLHQRPPRC